MSSGKIDKRLTLSLYFSTVPKRFGQKTAFSGELLPENAVFYIVF